MKRTTISLENTLFVKLRQLAAARHQTLTEIVNDIIAHYFRPTKATKPFRLEWKTMHGDRPPPVDPADRDRLYEVLDRRS